MKKRVLSMALCLVMLASVLPMSAFSTEDGATAATDTGAVTDTATVAPADAGATNAPAKTDAPMNTDAPAKTDAPANTDTPVNTDESAAGDDDTSDPTGKAEPAPTDEPAPTPEATDAPEVDEAVAAVQGLIDALPSAEDMTALVTAYLKGEELSEADSAALTEAYGKLDAAAEAYYALTDAQREQVDSARLEQLAALFNSEVEPLAEGDGDYFAEIDRDGTTITCADLATLQEALSPNDKVCFLKASKTGGILQIKSSGVKNVTIDLNGVDASNIEIQIENKSLTIKDNSGKTGSIKVSNQFLTEGDLTVEGGNVTFTGTIKTINVNSGNVNVEDADGFPGGTKVESITVTDGSLTISTGATIGNPNISTLDVNGGKVDIKSGIISTLNVANSTVDIAPGTVKNCNINGSNAILKGAAPADEEIYNVENLTVSNGDVKINFTEATLGANRSSYYFNVENLTVSPNNGSGSAEFNSGKINSVNVSGGALTINGGTVNYDGQHKNGYLTVTDGTVNINGGKINVINLGDKNDTGGNGTVNISSNVKPDDSGLAPITGLNYYAGELNFIETAESKFDKAKRVMDELHVNSDGLNGKLSGGVFWLIYSDNNNRKLSQLLADNCVIVDKDGKIVAADIISTTSGSIYNGPYYICNHNNATATEDGKCSVCGMQFVAKGVKGGTTTTEFYTQEQFFGEGFELKSGYTYTLYADIALGETASAPAFSGNISATFNLNGHSVSGTMVLGNGTNTLSLAITGAGDLSGLAFTVKDGSGLDLSGWTGDTSEGGKGLTLGGLDMSGISDSTNAQNIKVKPGMTITTFSGSASVQLKDWLKGSETAGAPWLKLTKGGEAQSALTDLDSLSNATVTIAECKTHSIIKDSPNEGMCDYCGHNFVASLTTGAGESETTTCYETFQSALNAAATAADGAVVTLLSNNPTDEEDQFGVTGGTFTLDFNGKNVDKPVNVKEGSVTIKSSGTGTGTVVGLNVGVDAEATAKADVTVESGKFGSIGVYNKGNLTFNGGTISRIDVGNTQANEGETELSGYSNQGNGTLSVTGGTVGALNYYSGTSVTLKGGKFVSINGNPAGYDASANTTNYNIYAKNVVDFLGDGYAYYTTASGEDDIVNTDTLTDSKKLEAKENTTYCVRSHTCSYPNADSELYPKCACGRECHHDGKVSDTGICDVCGKQLPIKETDEKGDLVRFLLQFPESDPLKDGHTYTLMADVTGDNVSLTSTRADEITINLNGHKFVPADGATGVTLDVNFVGATVAITGEGDLSNVTFKFVVDKSSTLDLSGWLGATDANGLTIAGLNIEGTTDDINIILQDGLVFKKIAFSNTILPDTSGLGSHSVSFTAGSILKKSGFKLVKVTDTTETDVEYNDTIGNDDNVYKVVKCPHTDASHDLHGRYSCKHCGQLLTVRVTAGTGAGATTYYTDIADAFEYAKDKTGCTVELLDDCTATAPLTASGKFTLDLRGYTLTLSNGNGNLNVTGDLTITSSRKEHDVNGKINGTVTVADSAKLTVSNKVKGQTSDLETCTPKIAKLTVSGGEATLTGGKFGSVEVSGGKLSVTNVTAGANVGATGSQTYETTTCIPEISKLTVNGGDVKLSGGKYSEVKYDGNKLGDLLDDTEDAKYGFKYVDNSKSVWHDSTWNATMLSPGGEDLGISVEKLPIQSVTTDPTDGKKAITFAGELTLKITGINGGNTFPEGTKFDWYRTENGRTVYLSSTNSTTNEFTQNPYILTSGETEIYCDVTVDGYTKTVKFDVMVEAKNLTGDDIGKISPPTAANPVYDPKITNGVYNGDGIPKSLMTNTPKDNKDPLELNKNGCIYEFKLAGEDEWQSHEELKRSDAGEYVVYWRLNGNGRYKFGGKPWYECPTPITAEIKPLTIDSVTVSDATKVYDGNTDLPTEAGKVTLNWTVKGADGDETHSLTIGERATGMVKLEFDSKDVGTDKTVTATLKSNSTLSKNFRFTSQDTPLVASTEGEITAAKLTVTAESYDIFIGESAPSLANPVPGTHYTISGYFESEKTEILASLNGRIALDYYDESATVKTTPNTSIESKYAIVPSLKENSTVTPTVFALTNGETQSDVLDNYELSFANGMLTVSEKPEYTITVIYGYNGTVAGPNGIIASPGTVTVKQGETPTFTITPNPGYVVASVKVDGVNYGSISTYTFPPIIDNHTIEATFMLPWGNPQTGVDVD